jgi:hypothetical protein
MVLRSNQTTQELCLIHILLADQSINAGDPWTGPSLVAPHRPIAITVVKPLW